MACIGKKEEGDTMKLGDEGGTEGGGRDEAGYRVGGGGYRASGQQLASVEFRGQW